jgi:hypothetical protein
VALRSGWRIDELAVGTGMPYDEITRLLYALAILGVVITADRVPAGAARSPTRPLETAAPPPSPAVPSAPATSATPATPAAPAATMPPPVQADPAVPVAAGVMAPPPAPASVSAAAPLPAAAPGPAASAPPPPPWPERLAGASLAGTGEVAVATAGDVPPPEAAALPPERRRNEIMQAYLSYRRLDAFDLLGTDEDASPAAVEEKYLVFARRFAPWMLGGREMTGMEEKARDLFLAGARAYSELLDLEQRNTLLFRRRAQREERSRRPPVDMAIKTDLLDPEVQYRKARALLDAGKLQEASLLLEFAADCDPQNGLYSAELAYCRFCMAPGHGSRALRELQETLRRDPDCGLAVYYSGEIERQMGHRDEAERLLRRAIKMMAPDRRPIDALKALSSDKRK